MHHYSIFELFSIGIGPSSSHTVGPMRAAHRFLEQIRHSPRLPEITGIRCECYGSLAATGHGHGTDTAIMLGLLGEEPHTVEPRSIPGKIARLHQQETLPVTEEKTVRFSPTRDLDLSHYQPLRLHPNGMLFTAVNQEGEPVEDAVFYSTGGGFVASEQELLHPEEPDREPFPLPYESAEELLRMADERECPLSSIVMANECALLPEREVREKLDLIWATMKQSISSGMSARGNLPGVLQVPRRAKTLRKSLLVHGESALKDPLSIMDWINLYAIAVSEENAAGGRIVTARSGGDCSGGSQLRHQILRFTVSGRRASLPAHRGWHCHPVQEKRLHLRRGRRLPGGGGRGLLHGRGRACGVPGRNAPPGGKRRGNRHGTQSGPHLRPDRWARPDTLH